MPPRSEQQLVEIVRQALQSVRNEPGNALRRGVAERSVTHSIAVYLHLAFPDLQVDCEYNRNGARPKYVDIPSAHLTPSARKPYREKAMKKRAKRVTTKKAIEQWTTFRTTTYPDILIHERGTNDRNLLVIEVKMAGDGRGEDGASVDVAKLRAFTSPAGKMGARYHYQLGLFIVLEETGETFRYFRHGEEIQEGELRADAEQVPASHARP
ncbi:hypothetical protein [Deinococcus ficus]|uniref:hypothetical protein n=1 Tax=Deinococcus ficus TaxID=317577 RepID=UPI0012DDDB4D|nr:hypothetical protein [Deinococcus ficus]